MAKLLCLCLAARLAALAAGGEVAQDASVLVQSLVRAHSEESSQRSSSGLGHLLDAAAAFILDPQTGKPPLKRLAEMELYDVFSRSSGKLVFTHLEESAEVEGAFALLTAEKAGRAIFGWGEKVDLLSVIHVPTSIRRGDKVSLTVNVTLDVANLADPMSVVFMGDTYTLTGLCGVCDGSCTLASSRDKDLFRVVFPTLIRNSEECKDGEPRENITDLVLMDRTMLLPHMDMAWLQMTGHVNISMAMLRDNRTLTSTAVSLSVQHDEKQAGKSTALVAEAEEEEDAVLGESEEDRALWKSEEAAEEAEMGHPHEGSVNAVVSDWVVHALEKPMGNISIRSNGGGCWAGDLGSTGCRMRFGETKVVSTHVHLATVVEQGSYMLLSITPKVNTLLGKIVMRSKVGKILDRYRLDEVELPLCGEPMDYQAFGEWHRWDPPGCGFYGFGLHLPEKEVMLSAVVMATPAFRTFKKVLPSVKMNLALLPPVSFNVRLKLLHYGGVPIADFEFKMGLEKTIG